MNSISGELSFLNSISGEQNVYGNAEEVYILELQMAKCSARSFINTGFT